MTQKLAKRSLWSKKNPDDVNLSDDIKLWKDLLKKKWLSIYENFKATKKIQPILTKRNSGSETDTALTRRRSGSES